MVRRGIATMAISIAKKMYQSYQAWGSFRRAMTQQYIDESSNAAAAFQAAQTNFIVGSATLTSKITQKRLSALALAKLDKIA